MRRILAGMGVLSLAALATTATATASPQDAGRTITICHATGSELNPYIAVTISVDAINGPNDHMGSHHDEDIIPPNDGSVLPGGRNLDKIDWWEAGCKDPGGAPDPVAPADPDPVVVPDPDPVEGDPVVVPGPDPVVVPDPDPVEGDPVVVPGPDPVEGDPVVVPDPDPVVVPDPEDENASEPGERPSSGPVTAGAVVAPGSVEAASGTAAGRNQGYSVQTAAAAAPSGAPLTAGLIALFLSAAVVAVRMMPGGTGRHTSSYK